MAAARVSLDCTGPATVAVLAHRDGRVEPLMFEGATELPSGVYSAENGQFLTGRAAVDAFATQPDRYCPSPLQLLATAPKPDTNDQADIVAALLRRVREQATQVAGAQVTQAVIVVPPGWGPQRRTRLRHAAHRAGLTEIEMVDAAAALAHDTHRTMPGKEPLVLVCRLAGTEADATILRLGHAGFEPLASIAGADVPVLDGASATEHLVDLATQALAAAEVTGAAITTTVLQVPAHYVSGVAAGLRQAGVTTTTRTATVADAVHGALHLAAGQSAATPRRLGRTRHAVAAAVPLPAAAALLWLLLHTGIYPFSPIAEAITVTPPDGLLTHWPAWSMVAVLVCFGALAVVLHRADRRLRQSLMDNEADRRGILARGLRIVAATTAAVGVVTAMLGGTTYPTLPLAQLLLWAAGPPVLLAATCMLIANLIRQGHTSALRWQLWLRLPNATITLAAVGLVLIHIDLYIKLHWSELLEDLAMSSTTRPPNGLDRLGTIAVALAMLPLLIRHTERQVLLSPVVIAVILWTNSYTNTTIVVGALVAAITVWWILRIRPAGAYSDPNHPASLAAAKLEPAGRSDR